MDLLKYFPIDELKIEIVHNGISDNYFIINSDNNDYSNEVVLVGARTG